MTDYLDQLQAALGEMERRRQTLDADIEAVRDILARHGNRPPLPRTITPTHKLTLPIATPKRTPRKGETRDAIVAAMTDGQEHSPKEIAAVIGKGPNAVSAAMLRMVKEGLLMNSGYARYSLPKTDPDEGPESGAGTPDENPDQANGKENPW